jgi:hypothetical protein
MGPFAAGQAPALAQALRETDRYDERMALADALGAVLGPLLKEAVPALDADTGRDPDYATIHSAAALLRLRRRDPASLRLLVDALADERLGSYAARLLSDLGSLAVPALDDIEKMTKGDGVPALRADYVLARLSPIAADAALARLCAVLDAPDDPRRIEAARLLAGLGPAAAPAVPDLIRALEGGDRDLSTAAANTLGAIGAAAESALPALETAAKEEDVRRPFPGGVMFRQAIRQIRESLAAEGASGPR